MMPALLALFLASCSSLAAGTEALDSATVEVNIGPMAGGPGAISAAEAAEMAVLNAPGLRAERESIALRDGAWKLGFRAFMPTLELGAGSDERLALHGPDSFTKTLSVSVGQPVWDGGRLHATRMLEASELALAKAELERAVRNTAEAAVTAYRSVVAARLRLGIERASLESTEAERDILATEVSLGLAKPSDLLEADMSLSDQRLRSAESELALAIACSELAEALGVGILPELSESPGRERAGLPLDEPRLISAVVERSPELEAARQSLYRKRAEAKAAASAWLPTIGLKASGQFGGTRFPLTRASWSLGLTVDFSGPYLSGSIGANRGGDIPSDHNAGTSLRLQALPNPSKAMGVRGAALASSLEEEKYSAAVASVQRAAKAAVNAYLNALEKREICADAFALAEARMQLVSLKVSLGQAIRSDAVEADLAGAAKEVELVDAVVAIIAAERGLEKLLDLAPGSLPAFIENCRFPDQPESDSGYGK